VIPSDSPTRSDVPQEIRALPVPRPFGDHELLAVIARDGPMVLWTARQRSLDRLVTVKFLNGGLLPVAEQERRLRREAATTGRLGHAGVIPVFEVGVADGQPFLSLPHLDGEPLAVRLYRGPLPVRVAADVLRQLAETLYEAREEVCTATCTIRLD
jgi:serine/threonine-protein kinase